MSSRVREGWLSLLERGVPRGVVTREGWLNVIKEGGVTQSCKPLHTYSRYGKYRAGKLLGTRGYYTCERGRDECSAKDSVVSRTFYSVSSRLAPAVGLSKDEFEFPTYSTPKTLHPPSPGSFFAPSSLSPSSFLSSARQLPQPPSPPPRRAGRPPTYAAPRLPPPSTISLLRIFLI